MLRKKHRKIVEICSKISCAARRCEENLIFFRSRRRIGLEINCLGALLDSRGCPKSIPFFRRDIFSDSPGTPGTQKEAIPLTLEDHLDPGRFPGAIFNDFGWILDAPGASRERFRDDFGKDYATFLPNATNPRRYVLYLYFCLNTSNTDDTTNP